MSEIIEPISTEVKGKNNEEPFVKFQVQDYILTVDKHGSDYDYRVENDDGETVIARENLTDKFWRKKRATGGLVKDLKQQNVLPEDYDRIEFKNAISEQIEEKLELWNAVREPIESDSDSESIEHKYSEERIKKARQLLEEENILQQVKTVLDYKVAGESKNKMGIFLHCLSKDSDEPLMIYGVSKQAEGKTFLIKKILELFPDDQIEEVTDMTQASIYRIAQEHGKDYYDGKIVNLGELSTDDEDDGVARIFRQLVSDGKVNKQLVLETDNGQKTEQLELEGAPVLIATTTEADRIDEEDLSRGVTYSPDMSDAQKKLVREFQNVQNELPVDVFYPEEIEELEKTITCALDIIAKEDVTVRNPYTRVMDDIIPVDTDNSKRDYPKVMKIVAKAVTRLYQYQRPRTERNNREYCLASWEDIVRGLLINQDFINNMLDNTLDSAIQVFEKIESNIEVTGYTYDELKTIANKDGNIDGNPFTNRELMDLTGMKKNTIYNITRELDRQKLIFKDNRHRPHKHYLPEDALIQRGITPNTHLQIVESCLDGKGVGDYFKRTLDYWGFDQPDDVKEKLMLDSDELPFTLETGLGRSNDYEPPIYLRNIENEEQIYTTMKIDRDEDGLFIEFKGPADDWTVRQPSATSSESDDEEDEDEDGIDDYNIDDDGDNLLQW